jgi:hypothetical protein
MIFMNKKVGLILSALVLSSFLIGAVSAAAGLSQLIREGIDGAVVALGPGLQALLGETNTGDVFMGKLLIVIILMSLVFVVLDRAMGAFFAERRWPLWLLSIVIPLLGVRFLSPEMVNTIILPNSVFAIAITSILPFILFGYFIYSSGFNLSKGARRLAWVFFAVVFLGLYNLRSEELGDIAYIYPLTALIAFIMAIMDGTIRGLLLDMKRDKAKASMSGGMLGIYENKLAKVHETFEIQVKINKEDEYLGTTQGNVGKKGELAYATDVNYYEVKIRNLLKKL